MAGEVYGDEVPRLFAFLLGLVVLAGLLVYVQGLGDDLACSEPFAERIDPNSSQHVLPGGSVPAYTTDPPTSGAHRPGPQAVDVLDTELDKPTQVGILESGRVLIQYRDTSVRAELEDLAKSRPGSVTVAPNSSLPTKIVATAWSFKMECTDVSSSDLRSFIRDHAQKATGH